MKNIFKYLIEAYFNKLVSLNLNLPVYDGIAPSSEKGSYILISSDRNSQQTPNKAGFSFTVQILIDVVIKNGNFGFKDSDNIAELITQALNSDQQLDLTPDFQIISTVVLSQNTLSGLNPTEPTFRTLIRYQHLVSQL